MLTNVIFIFTAAMTMFTPASTRDPKKEAARPDFASPEPLELIVEMARTTITGRR